MTGEKRKEFDMKYRTYAMVFLLGGIGMSAVGAERGSSGQDWALLRKGVSAQRQVLADKGAYLFVTDEMTPRRAPHIHSQCWVDWLPDDEVERKAYEQEKRDFGLDMAVQLEKLGARRIEMDDVAGLRTGAEQLVAIAEWAKTSPGYGNYILKHQAEELAMVLMAKMAVNEKCSIREVRELLDRIDTHEKSAYLQVSVLNEESPHAYARPTATSGSEIQSALGRQWRDHVREAREHFKARLPKGRRVHFEDVRDEAREYAFYIPDRNLGDASISRYWNLKDHEEVCVYGMYSQKREKIGWILKYRETIGAIPVPRAGELESEESQERYVGRINDAWLAKGFPSSVKPVGRIVLWIYCGQFL